jgi:hypothetical protein
MRAMTDEVVVPFVVAAMTSAEATDLISGTVFNDPNVAPAERAHFQKFKQALGGYGLSDLQHFYKEQRETWTPSVYPSSSIDQIIFDTLQHINEHHRRPLGLPRLLPNFLSEEFFSEDRAVRNHTLKQLRQSAGIIIIDGVSMFHPVLHQRITQSEISSKKRVAILVVSPIDTTTTHEVKRLIEQVIDSRIESAFTRFDSELDHLCEIGVDNLRDIKRRLFTILPETAANLQEQRPNPAAIERLEQMRGEEPSGFDPARIPTGGR